MVFILTTVKVAIPSSTFSWSHASLDPVLLGGLSMTWTWLRPSGAGDAFSLGLIEYFYGICSYYCRVKLLLGALVLEWLLRALLSPTEPTYPIIMT